MISSSSTRLHLGDHSLATIVSINICLSWFCKRKRGNWKNQRQEQIVIMVLVLICYDRKKNPLKNKVHTVNKKIDKTTIFNSPLNMNSMKRIKMNWNEEVKLNEWRQQLKLYIFSDQSEQRKNRLNQERLRCTFAEKPKWRTSVGKWNIQM